MIQRFTIRNDECFFQSYMTALATWLDMKRETSLRGCDTFRIDVGSRDGSLLKDVPEWEGIDGDCQAGKNERK